MALTAEEGYRLGFVRTANGAIAMTTSLVGTTFRTGFLRDADGRLVVKYG